MNLRHLYIVLDAVLSKTSLNTHATIFDYIWDAAEEFGGKALPQRNLISMYKKVKIRRNEAKNYGANITTPDELRIC